MALPDGLLEISPLAAFRHPGRASPSGFRWLLTLSAAALMLCTVAWLNGGPIYYPDTSAYLIDADRLFHRQPPYGVRPVFYGLLIWICRAVWPFSWGAGFGLALFLQAFVVAHLIYVTQRAVGAALQPVGFLVLTAALVLLTPVSFHISHMLPDIFVAVSALACFLLAFCRETSGGRETVYLFLLAAGSACCHLAAIPVDAAVVGLAVLLALWRRRRWAGPALAAGSLALGAAVLLAFSALVFQRLTFEPKGPPHFLARVLADGPGVDYLRATCPGSGYTLCRYLDRFPLTEDGFMWGMMSSVPTADGYAIKAEQSEIVRGTLAMFPAPMLWHALQNALRQMVTFGAATQVSPAEWAKFVADGMPEAASLAHTRQAKGAFDGTALDGINALQAGVTFISLLVAIGTLPRLLARGLTRPAALTATTLLVLLTNATFCGALAGVFARYQGRLIWLLPLTAVIAIRCLTDRARRPTVGGEKLAASVP